MLNRILGILIIAVSFAIAWLMMDFNQFADGPMNLPTEGVNYTLDPGTSTASLARDLTELGYLDKPLYFRLLARWEDLAHKIKAGEFQIPAATSPRQLLNLLVSGKVTTYSLTLVEGWNFKQMRVAIAGQQALEQTLVELSDQEIMQRLGYADEHPEGRFLPDTYHFPKGTTDLAFLKRAYQAMQGLLDAEWEQRDPGLPLNSPYEALILASIVEKETGLASERPEIAGVFVRRLKKGMKLQTDPTIIYGMGESYKGNIRRRDLKQDTPYNTYLHKGLTPTPISMPGADALHAVLHPKEGKSLYFVAKGEGSHQFSKTLVEHNRAVRKYQLKR